MKGTFYRILMTLSRYLGDWVLSVTAKCIAAGFFFFSPRRLAGSLRFYRVLLPHFSMATHFKTAWHQYLNFTHIFVDRFRLGQDGAPTYTSRGWEHIEQTLNTGKGGIILMSHLGNWEMAAHLLKQRQSDLPLLLYMGARHSEQIEKMQKSALSRKGIRIIVVDQEGGSPMDIVEGIHHLRAGGLISMTADRFGAEEKRSVGVDFLGRRVKLPQTPYLLALLGKVPLFIFFAIREPDGRYAIKLEGPLWVKAANRQQRSIGIHRAAQKYADCLENTVREHPAQWFHFTPFLENRRK